jgi:hypothetical protein
MQNYDDEGSLDYGCKADKEVNRGNVSCASRPPAFDQFNKQDSGVIDLEVQDRPKKRYIMLVFVF